MSRSRTRQPGGGLSGREALRERVKELTCLYEIAQIAASGDDSLERVLNRIVRALPPAWRHPEAASAQIVLDGRSCRTGPRGRAVAKQSADVVVRGQSRGRIIVAYHARLRAGDEGPFLREERHLIDAVARQVALIVERREAEREKERLRAQLRHADRLATIGQLAAGVAHELNEPLGNILGFAQLIQKAPRLSRQTAEDAERIVRASLYAREVIRKLVLFARPAPPRKMRVDLNQLAGEGLSFFEARCVKAGVRLEFLPEADLPPVVADPAQLNQVLVNLVVNAIQAMPDGGRLSVATEGDGRSVSLVVRDTGVGMTGAVRKQIFVPFFTTKDVDEGTGLGLSVVHGIVTAHGGTIRVRSRPGRGSCFTVRLPREAHGVTQEKADDRNTR